MVKKEFDLLDSSYGIQFKCPKNTKIKAPIGGIVLVKKWVQGEGYILVLGHGDGLITVFTNLHKVFSKKGQLVESHEIIGVTNQFKDEIIYFQTWFSGSFLNPSVFFNLSKE